MREAHLPGRLPQVLGTVLVSVVLGQVRRRVTVLVPQRVVHVVGDQGPAALRGGGRCDPGLRPRPWLSLVLGWAGAVHAATQPVSQVGNRGCRGPGLTSPSLATATRSWQRGTKPCRHQPASRPGAQGSA